jgi:methyl-accepting chemotaxis protein
MITKRKLLMSIAKTDLITYPILVPLAGYVAYFTGGFTGSSALYLLMDVGIAASLAFIFEVANINRLVTHLLTRVGDESCDRVQAKKEILYLPIRLGIQYIFQWVFGVSLVILLLFFQIDLTIINVMPFILLLPIMAMLNYNIGFLQAENSLDELLSHETIRDIALADGTFGKIDLNLRIALLTVSVILIPVVILGYVLYLVSTKQVVIENIGLHIAFITFLSAITIFVSINLLMKNVKKSNSVLMTALNSIKDGNLAIQGVPMITSSEVGMISQTANALILKLRDVIGIVKRSSDMVAESSNNIQEASETLSQSASEQASGIEEISSTIEEMLSTVTQNADAASQAEKLSEQSYVLAEKGNGVMDEAVGAINQINKSSEKIGAIIGIMNDIAFQTNLLSLNAAVEAARAGEHGRSFAVVAGEVRNLAQRSAASSKEIEGLIKTSVEQVYEGTRLAGDSGGALKEIFATIAHVRQMIIEISATSREQKLGLNQITDAVSQTDTLTQQNAAAAEELSTTAEALSANAGELKEAVDYFKV